LIVCARAGRAGSSLCGGAQPEGPPFGGEGQGTGTGGQILRGWDSLLQNGERVRAHQFPSLVW